MSWASSPLFSYVHFILHYVRSLQVQCDTPDGERRNSPKLSSVCFCFCLFHSLLSVGAWLCLVCKSRFTLGVKTDLLCHKVGIRASHWHNFLLSVPTALRLGWAWSFQRKILLGTDMIRNGPSSSKWVHHSWTNLWFGYKKFTLIEIFFETFDWL